MSNFDQEDRNTPRWSGAVGRALALFLLLLLPGNALALDPSRDISQYNCQTWSRQNGLPVNGINAVTQTKDGYLWLGTSAGLVRFDGVEFKLFDLARVSHVPSTIVRSLDAARNGGVWVGLENGSFGLFDGNTFSFRGKAEWGGANMNVRTILETTNGTLWIAAEGQAATLTPAGDYKELLTKVGDQWPNVLRAFAGSHGRVWFGTSGHGVFYWQEGQIVKLDDPTVTTVISIAEDSEGQIWLGTDTGLKCYDTQLRPKAIPAMPGEIRTLLADRHGVLWIGTASQGLLRYYEGVYTSLQKINGLAGDFVASLAEDSEGSLWVGTPEGISQITDVKFPTQAVAQDNLPKDIATVGASQHGGVWIGSRVGLTYFDGKPKNYSTEAGVPPAAVKRVFEASNGDVYLVSGMSTLAVFSHDRVVATMTAPTLVVGMAEDSQGVVVSVGGGLFRVETNVLTPYLFTNGTPDFHWILNLAKGKDGCLWVASQRGIFRVKDGAYQQWSTAQGLLDADVQFIIEDSDGIVWAAGRSGITRLKDNQIRNVTRQDGLLDDNIYAMVPDDSGHFWLDSGRGIFRVARQDLNDFADGKRPKIEYVGFDNPESVKPTDKSHIQEHAGCKSLDGRIWFPSSQGAVIIDPAHIPDNPFAPPVHVTSIRANGTDFEKSASIVVLPGNGELEIHFAGLSFIAPQKMRFRYRLQGYDNDWVETADRRLAFYTNLKPGQYAFTVMAANADGVWNKSGDTFRLELRPHYYQTAWFDGLCALVVLSAIAGIFAWRVRHLHRTQAALKKSRDLLEIEVQHRTAELAQSNSALLQRSESLENQIAESKRMQLEIDRVHRELLLTSRQAGMAEVATSVLHNVGNVLNSVNVSASVVTDRVKQSRQAAVARVATMLQAHAGNLGEFIEHDPKGRMLPSFLSQLAEHLALEQAATLEELAGLSKNVQHINDIVATQQTYAKVYGVVEKVRVADLMNDALRMNESSLLRHDVQIERDYAHAPAEITVDRHKVIQILVNLVSNAKHACQASAAPKKKVALRVSNGGDTIRIAVCDNGVGIAPENLTRVFSHGFTTKKNGHGFGLHSGALAAKELGGTLTVQSEGPGKGAQFTLELPLEPKTKPPAVAAAA